MQLRQDSRREEATEIGASSFRQDRSPQDDIVIVSEQTADQRGKAERCGECRFREKR